MFKVIKFRRIDKEPAKMEKIINEAIKDQRLICAEYGTNEKAGSSYLALSLGKKSDKSPNLKCRVFRTNNLEDLETALNSVDDCIPIKHAVSQHGSTIVGILFYGASQSS